jgi:hypothetical protein
MNRRQALKLAESVFKGGKAHVPTWFTALNGVVIVPLHGANATLAVYGPRDLANLRAACEIAEVQQRLAKGKATAKEVRDIMGNR